MSKTYCPKCDTVWQHSTSLVEHNRCPRPSCGHYGLMCEPVVEKSTQPQSETPRFDQAYKECLDDAGNVTRLEPLYKFAACAEKELTAAHRENDKLRGILAKGKGDCVYCGLPAERISECKHGFPGCGRMDDIMCAHESEQIKAAQREIARLKQRAEQIVDANQCADSRKMVEADTRRLDWLQDSKKAHSIRGYSTKQIASGYCWWVGPEYGITKQYDTLRQAIDAAMKEGK